MSRVGAAISALTFSQICSQRSSITSPAPQLSRRGAKRQGPGVPSCTGVRPNSAAGWVTMHPVRRAVLIASVALLLVPAGGASSLPLTTRLANALAVRGNSTDASGAVAVDLATGRTLFARHADLALEPASNEKLAVAFAALHELGPSYRFRT